MPFTVTTLKCLGGVFTTVTKVGLDVTLEAHDDKFIIKTTENRINKVLIVFGFCINYETKVFVKGLISQKEP